MRKNSIKRLYKTLDKAIIFESLHSGFLPSHHKKEIFIETTILLICDYSETYIQMLYPDKKI